MAGLVVRLRKAEREREGSAAKPAQKRRGIRADQYPGKAVAKSQPIHSGKEQDRRKQQGVARGGEGRAPEKPLLPSRGGSCSRADRQPAWPAPFARVAQKHALDRHLPPASPPLTRKQSCNDWK